MKFREFKLESGAKLILGKDENSNDELVKKFEGSRKVILHTSKPGSPFGVIDKTGRVSKKEIYEAAAVVAWKSQDWRDRKTDVVVDVFTGKNVSKPKGYKPGSWKVSGKIEKIKIEKKDILNLEKG